MNRFIIILGALLLLLISCQKEYTQAENNRIEEMNSSQVYKVKVPDDAFVFCLDTIKADDEYQRFSEEFCRRGQEVDSYLYLSSYKVYLPTWVNDGCGMIICGLKMRSVNFIVNKNKKWLVDDELVEGFNQGKEDSILTDYYSRMKKIRKNQYSMINFESRAIKNDKERDDLYMSILSGYYSFIKQERNNKKMSIDSLQKEFPFRLSYGDYFLMTPPLPPPINSRGIEIYK